MTEDTTDSTRRIDTGAHKRVLENEQDVMALDQHISYLISDVLEDVGYPMEVTVTVEAETLDGVCLICEDNQPVGVSGPDNPHGESLPICAECQV